LQLLQPNPLALFKIIAFDVFPHSLQVWEARREVLQADVDAFLAANPGMDATQFRASYRAPWIATKALVAVDVDEPLVETAKRRWCKWKPHSDSPLPPTAAMTAHSLAANMLLGRRTWEYDLAVPTSQPALWDRKLKRTSMQLRLALPGRQLPVDCTTSRTIESALGWSLASRVSRSYGPTAAFGRKPDGGASPSGLTVELTPHPGTEGTLIVIDDASNGVLMSEVMQNLSECLPITVEAWRTLGANIGCDRDSVLRDHLDHWVKEEGEDEDNPNPIDSDERFDVFIETLERLFGNVN
jgi:hypothetical protein